MRRGRFKVEMVLGYGAFAVLALVSSGCATVLVGGAVAGGAAAGYAYYKGNMQQDYPATFDQTWVATYSALHDLGLPIVHYDLGAHRGEIQSRGPNGERIGLYVEHTPFVTGPLTRVQIRVGVFGSKPLSQQIHTQIAIRLQNPSPLPPGAPSPFNAVPVSENPGGPPPAVAMPAETGAPPLAGSPEVIVPVSTSGEPTPPATPAVPWKSAEN